MDEKKSKKLKLNIKRNGRYEPLTVRPHPLELGKFQIINGHNRLRILKDLGHASAFCTVWDIDDAQTNLYLATLNRLCGCDVPERRALLIENLLSDLQLDELAGLLPDDMAIIEKMAQLTKMDVSELKVIEPLEVDEIEIPCILSFMLTEADAKEVNLALDLIVSELRGMNIRGKALVELARFYIKQNDHCAAL